MRLTRVALLIYMLFSTTSCGLSDGQNISAQPSTAIIEAVAEQSSITLPLGVMNKYSGPTGGMEGWITAPNGNKIYTRIALPPSADASLSPALVILPGGTGAGARMVDIKIYQELADAGFVVVGFNPEGRGSGRHGDKKSEGEEDCNGYIQQDDLKAVVEYIASQDYVDPTSIGVVSNSFGISIGAGAVGRYPELPVSYLIDVEGPHDSRVITFYDVGRETEICGHLSLATDPSKSNVSFWMEREAVRHIGGFKGRYMRVQSEIDHAQGEGYFRHAIEMINAATKSEYGGTGAAEWTRMNGEDIGNNVNGVFVFGDMSAYPRWVSGRVLEHSELIRDYVLQMTHR